MEIAVGSQPRLWQSNSAEAHIAEVIAPGVVLLAVADGFGAVRGQPVAAVTLAAVRDALKRRVRHDTRDPRSHLTAAFSAANARIFAQTGGTDDYVAGGTSLTAALIVEDHAYVAHVGQARAYLCRDGSLAVLTQDDALAGDEWVRVRSHVPTEARTGTLLTRTLGTQATLEASMMHVRLMHADALVLATGGVHEAVAGDEMAYALRAAQSSTDAATRLLEILKSRGGPGGGTVIVGRALTESAAEEPQCFRPATMRTAAFVLTVVFMLTLIAIVVLHTVFAP
ncbi:MAG: PP2C family serine/threonine-protein phosphatase [Candidatus Velthaea sp.]